jgi:D-arabinose 1-dehydrogenase-like Zn-dependent alcohol dehydrogenase
VRGSYLGTREDLAATFALALEGAVRPHVHIHALAETPVLLESMRRGEFSGRAVIAF